MQGYKIRQSIIFRDNKASMLRVFPTLGLYQKLMDESEKWFREDENIVELGLYFCWDNDAGLVTEACLLRMWSRGLKEEA